MKHLLHTPHSMLVLIAMVLLGGWCAPGSAQIDPVLVDLRNRLIEETGEEYVEARNEALELPQAAFHDLLFLLRLSPEYSLEQILALILEARANHPAEAARFDASLQHMLANPDIGGRSGQPIYRPWTGLETKEAHPFVYEVFIKRRELPSEARSAVRAMTITPNPDNIPFILHFAKHHSPGVLYDLVSATKGHPGEREWLRPLAVQMYKENREQGNVLGSTGIIGMFQGFGTPEDLKILNQLREFEQEMMPAQGIVIGDWDEIGRTWYAANREHKQRETELANAEPEAAPAHVIQQRRQALEEAEAVASEADRQYYGNMLWRRLDETIQHVEIELGLRDRDPL